MSHAHTFMVLSTNHVSADTAKYLDENDHNDWPVTGGPFSIYGWFMYAHDADEEDLDIPADLRAIFDYVRSCGHTHVLLDCDGDILADLPTYEWEV